MSSLLISEGNYYFHFSKFSLRSENYCYAAFTTPGYLHQGEDRQGLADMADQSSLQAEKPG